MYGLLRQFTLTVSVATLRRTQISTHLSHVMIFVRWRIHASSVDPLKMALTEMQSYIAPGLVSTAPLYWFDAQLLSI